MSALLHMRSCQIRGTFQYHHLECSFIHVNLTILNIYSELAKAKTNT